ncbi:hypothetical protein TTHERM_00925720 (macronuclear) [Tetrahymena thermophila SB210]|uniref:Uncharacterized protein n=1 Tax=Tetrahymena thermophila (strain SB210) TaxID=312017 RepID=Q22DY7_TETTS|nr:hypothetical protein TTHERM_00925720 [Tetrahymena thermophila SB210]EAR83525.2 hypothetical protein TTHERM_00925720 [Tetrahymena thermophila SB210]|eukprot:XP_001031188.2 hypothetical protein TTHERM_00925720 [Tetrahymena thermophila SB210]
MRIARMVKLLCFYPEIMNQFQKSILQQNNQALYIFLIKKNNRRESNLRLHQDFQKKFLKKSKNLDSKLNTIAINIIKIYFLQHEQEISLKYQAQKVNKILIMIFS